MKVKKLLATVVSVVTALLVTVSSASACTMLYVGSDLTSTGDTYMSRSEDYSNYYNKVAYVSEHGKHPAGEEYVGCTFKFTFTHDSYAYTAVSDDNLVGVGNEEGECPNCGGTHQHTPMEEGGTNEMGVSVSAMDSVYSLGAVKSADPFKNSRNSENYMSEGDMNTILLGECATAKEAVELLCSIYDTYGVSEGSGVQISDQKETWYVENYSGTQYIAVKLAAGTVAFNANVGIIGLIDLDDTENVIASSKVIEIAQTAGTFVGDAENNIIDYRASYSSPGLNSRVWNGLNYLCGVDTYTQENTTPDDITISNVKDGEIVPVYSNIQLKEGFGTKDMVDFYKVNTIGKSGNLEWHIFQISAEGDYQTATVEWQGINHGGYSVAIPYYSVLTTDVYEGYKVGGLGNTSFVTELPDGCTGYFATTGRVSGQTVPGYRVYPAGWEQGVYWTNDVLSNYADSSACSAEDKAMIKANIAVMQDKCYAVYEEMKAVINDMDVNTAKAFCTEKSAALAKEAHELALALYKDAAFDVHAFEKGACKYCGEKDVTYNPFVDVSNTSVYKNAILWAYYKQPCQIVAGFDAEHFAPNATCTRAQAVAFMWRAAGCPEPTTECSFVDVSADSVYFKAICWAAEEGIVAGYDATHFAPNDTVTRAQFVTFLWREAGCPDSVASYEDFADADAIAAPYQTAAAWAVENGIVFGFEDGTFRPNVECARWAAVLLMARFDALA
ncbi:MAG: C69 family dipeptidase [Oscillospiraceae bacterium]|nr:C69 family dipeptidase [Oscillospiraceae bacterium]